MEFEELRKIIGLGYMHASMSVAHCEGARKRGSTNDGSSNGVLEVEFSDASTAVKRLSEREPP